MPFLRAHAQNLLCIFATVGVEHDAESVEKMSGRHRFEITAPRLQPVRVAAAGDPREVPRVNRPGGQRLPGPQPPEREQTCRHRPANVLWEHPWLSRRSLSRSFRDARSPGPRPRSPKRLRLAPRRCVRQAVLPQKHAAGIRLFGGWADSSRCRRRVPVSARRSSPGGAP